jgi:dTDP-4-dehydrorhamnose 3,5-epimerase
MGFSFEDQRISGVVLIKAAVYPDERGSFAEVFKRSEFVAGGITAEFVQDNRSHSARGVLRGLHYQLRPESQGKLIYVMRGVIFDVAVDIRAGSPTYAEWVGVQLTSEEHTMLYVPEGFAHGFQVISKEADVIYKVTQEYAPHAERGIAWNDPAIGIEWPITPPILSERDASLPFLRSAESNFVFEAGS